MVKTAEMHWGEVRSAKKTALVKAAETALNAERYEEARRLANSALRLASSNNPKGRLKLKRWRQSILARIPSRKTLEKRTLTRIETQAQPVEASTNAAADQSLGAHAIADERIDDA